MNLLWHVHGSTNMEKRSNKRNELMANVTERQNSILKKKCILASSLKKLGDCNIIFCSFIMLYN
jgi:hypothetical protein